MPSQPPADPRGPPGPDDPADRVARERTGPGGPQLRFWIPALLLAGVTAAVLLTLAITDRGQLAAETGSSGTLFAALVDVLGVASGRILAALAGAATVLGTAFAIRALTHSDLAGLVAAGLLLLDPAFLVTGHLAMVDPLLSAVAVWALVLALTDRPWAHWALVPVMAAGTLLSPLFLVWGIPLAAILFLRGHIYAAPKHLATSASQAVLLPALGALPVQAIVWGLGGQREAACASIGRLDFLLVRVATDFGGTVAVHNPVLVIGGALALAGLAFAALLHILSRFRLARLPGRIQVRLPDPLPRLHGRSLWLLLLAVAAPLPLLWLPLFAAALALGARQLGRDAPWFGIMVHSALFVFAAVYLVRLLPFVTGEGGDLTAVLPWVDVVACPAMVGSEAVIPNDLHPLI